MNNYYRDLNYIFQGARETIKQDASIPPKAKDGILKLIQAMVEDTETSLFSQNRNNLINFFIKEIIYKYSLMDLVKQQADELDALKSIGMNLTSSLDLQTVLDAVVTEAMRLVKNARLAHIYLYSHGTLNFGASLNADGVKNKAYAVPRPKGLTYSVANSGERIIVEDILHHPLFKDMPPDWAGSMIGIPLKSSNSIVGVMNLSRTVAGSFTNAELRLIGLLADQAAVAISNASLHKAATELANRDSVTGLPNRRALDERLQEDIRVAKRNSSQFSVVMMDLDGFKNVNDTYGHVAGDEILHSLFNYLAENIRPTDFLARYGGDELTLITRDADLGVAEYVTQKIIQLVQDYTPPIPEISNAKLSITGGIALYPVHARSAGDLLRAADSALYQAKKHHRGSFSVAKGASGPLDPITEPRK